MDTTCFDILDIPIGTSKDDIHNAYIKKVKEYHYDNFRDIEEQEFAQHKMVELNNAYKSAIKYSEYTKQINIANNTIDYRDYAKKLYSNKQYEGALFQLERDSNHDEQWHYIRGLIYYKLERYLDSYNSFKTAVNINPSIKAYRQGAFDAAVAYNKQNFTLSGKIRKHIKKYFKI